MSIWELGETAGPLLIGPLSEIFGRKPVYHVANWLFIVCSTINGFSVNIHMVIAFRFLSGLCVASLSLNPPILGDLFAVEQRGRAMAIMSVAPLFGTSVGPIVGGYLSASLSWRWTFWLVAILTTCVELALILVYQETYRVVILQKKAKCEQSTGKASGQTDQEACRQRSVTTVLKAAVSRPLWLLVRSPVLALITVYVSLVYGYTYLVFTTLAEVFETTYNFSQGPVGLTYLGIGMLSRIFKDFDLRHLD